MPAEESPRHCRLVVIYDNDTPEMLELEKTLENVYGIPTCLTNDTFKLGFAFASTNPSLLAINTDIPGADQILKSKRMSTLSQKLRTITYSKDEPFSIGCVLPFFDTATDSLYEILE